MRTQRSLRRFGAAAALNAAILGVVAGAAHAQDDAVLAPVDPAVTAALVADSVDVANGVSDLRLLAVLAVARAQIGKPYTFATRGPDSFDCSGLVDYAYRAAGYRIGGWTGAQVTAGTAVTDLSQMQPGDLVFIPGADGTLLAPGHVGLYVGDGLVIQATHTGDVVRITPLANWIDEIAAVRRIIGPRATDRSAIPGAATPDP